MSAAEAAGSAGEGRWQWQVFLQDTGGGQTYGEWLLSAWGWTVAVAATAWLLALVIGVGVGVLRSVPSPWARACGAVWVEVFRGIPLLVQVFLWYFVLPALVPAWRGGPGFVYVVLALGCFTSARVAEQVRAGLASLPRGQKLAALALGLDLPQAYRYVLLPAALRVVLPPLTSEAMNIVKNSSVAFAVSISELTLFAMQAQEETARGPEIYLAVTGLYAITALGAGQMLGWVGRRLGAPGERAPPPLASLR